MSELQGFEAIGIFQKHTGAVTVAVGDDSCLDFSTTRLARAISQSEAEFLVFAVACNIAVRATEISED